MAPSKRHRKKSGKSKHRNNEENRNDNDNPLRVPEVLQIILGYLGIEALMNCRLVNKLWYQNATRFWFKCRPTVTTKSFLEIEHISQTITNGTLPVWPNYTRFKLLSLSLGGGDWYRIDPFWMECGQRMTDLTIDCTFQDVRTLKSVLFCRFTPNLVSLKATFALEGSVCNAPTQQDVDDRMEFARTFYREMEVMREDLQFRLGFQQRQVANLRRHEPVDLEWDPAWNWRQLDRHYADLIRTQNNMPVRIVHPKLTKLWLETKGETRWDVPVCWVELLSYYTGLKKFHVYFRHASSRWSTYLDGVDRVFRALTSIREVDNSSLNLTELGFTSPAAEPTDWFGRRAFQLLQRAQLSLDTLQVDMTHSVESDILLLRQLSATPLRRLILTSTNELHYGGMSLPMMESLWELTMVGTVFGDMAFIEHAPNLRSLSMVGGNFLELVFQDSVLSFEDAVRLESLSHFKIETTKPVTVLSMTLFRRLAPNMISLDMRVSNGVLQVISGKWSNLHHLKFSICVANHVTMTKALLKFKQLRSLSCDINSFSNALAQGRKWEVADRVEHLIFRGFLRMTSLESLTLMLPPNVFTTKVAQAALYAKIKEVKISQSKPQED